MSLLLFWRKKSRRVLRPPLSVEWLHAPARVALIAPAAVVELADVGAAASIEPHQAFAPARPPRARARIVPADAEASSGAGKMEADFEPLEALALTSMDKARVE